MNGYIIDKFQMSTVTDKQDSAVKLLGEPKKIG